ncbi:GGDEF domain-containing protein [Marinobacteraceae bacterium S3BR75-40.1]
MARKPLQKDFPPEKLIAWCSIIAIAITGAFGVKHILAGTLVPAFCLWASGLLLGANLLWYLRRGHLELFRWGFIATIFLLFFYITISGLEQGAAALWLYVYPPLIFYIVRFWAATIVSFCGLGLVILGLTPWGPINIQHEYSLNFQIMFILTLAFEVVFCCILDLSRRRARRQLVGLVSELDHAARYDGLTNLVNRREGHRQLELAMDRLQVINTTFCVLLIDVDLFKRLNDTYGHDAGDHVLKTLSDIFSSTCRKSDVVSRWGGEEFLVLLLDTNREEGLNMAERIRRAVEEYPFDYQGEPLKVTLSIGLADSSEAPELDTLLKEADRRLYVAKSEGRNQVRDAVPGEPPLDEAAVAEQARVRDPDSDRIPPAAG